ncbi:hypothetical protein Cgig2_018234 [Carnegiea gigantea]|uniref:Rubisco LSMT substrate-binding domain-containing protein n=1 Tax=Carnegiea gigantea TaxID=171969 RepID=A0A9Q1KYW2_9CARY|nr:hypothetical protein Cgig2_018234 [Carnegiea gigantea]
MALTTGPLKFLGFRRSLLTLSRHFLVKFKHCVPADSFKDVKCRDEDCDDFLPWLENKAGMEISSVLSIGTSKYGRSLFASKNIQAGDCLLKVPFDVQISPDNLLPEIKSLIGEEVGHTAKLAVVVLLEQRKGQDSEWAPYISRLPKPGDMHSTIFWSEDELEMIRQSPVFQETVDQRAQIRKNYLAVKPALDHFPEIFEHVRFDDFRYACGLVSSRAWGSLKGLSLIPFADFLNHDGTSQSVVLTDEDRQISEVVADRNYIPGDEGPKDGGNHSTVTGHKGQVLIRYGKFPNSALLLDFGFTVSSNIYDQVWIQVDIPYHDHLRELKLDLLHSYWLRMIKDASFSSAGGSFLIKKVKSSRGKGKGIPQSLRAFARVMSCASSQELRDVAVEASQNDGRLARHPLINQRKELQAHHILLSLFDELIEKYDMSIKSLHALKSATNSSAFMLRRQMAWDLLRGEVDVLRSASAWLKNYCFSCQQQSLIL